MDSFATGAASAVAIGAGATAFMDLWLALLRALGLPTLDFALLGRWAGHGARGRWAHDSIARAAPVPGERALGWAVHYLTGIGFAALLVLAAGPAWLAAPTPAPALLLGLGTVAAPLFILQPAMGAGIASSRTAAPLRNCLRSVLNHAVFGGGLYAAAVLASRF